MERGDRNSRPIVYTSFRYKVYYVSINGVFDVCNIPGNWAYNLGMGSWARIRSV